jgi:hypothetical protein
LISTKLAFDTYNIIQQPPTAEPSDSPTIQPSFSSTIESSTTAKHPPPKKDALKAPDERIVDVDSDIDSSSGCIRCSFNSAIVASIGVLLMYF